ncbi:hypothetical protein D3C72_2293010 [compost metagenome]
MIGVPDLLERDELQVFPAKRLLVARGEVAKGHLVAAADLGVQEVDLAGVSIGGEPLGDRVGFQEGAIDALGSRAQDA